MQNLTIVNTEIRQLDGLYSLNDLHQASGAELKHKPANFMRLDTTLRLIEEIRCSDLSIIPTKTITGKGKAQGTYVCKELVYAYAMWISPSFHLKVIQAYDRMATMQHVPPQQTAGSTQPQPVRDLLLVGQEMCKVKGVNEVQAMACTLEAIERATGLPTTMLAKALPSVAPAGISMDSDDRFIEEWIDGQTPWPFVPCAGSDLYASYLKWCRTSGEGIRDRAHFLAKLGRKPGWENKVFKIYTQPDVHCTEQKTVRMIMPPPPLLEAKQPVARYRIGAKEEIWWRTECYFAFKNLIHPMGDDA